VYGLNCIACSLRKDGLALALGPEVTLEALAKASGIVADPTAGAVTAKVVALAKKHVTARWALLEGAVRTTSTDVAHAADVLECVPWSRVSLGSFVRELLLRHAATAAIAVGWAHSTLTGLAIVVVEALALASLAIAQSLVRALSGGVCTGVGGGQVNPGGGLRARAQRAIVLGPGGVVVLRAIVAGALIVCTTATVAGASIGAVSNGCDEESCEDYKLHHVC